MYVPAEGADAWDQFSGMAAEAKMSVSALLMLLIRAYIDGRLQLHSVPAQAEIRPCPGQ